MTFDVEMNVRWVKLKTKTPVTRNGQIVRHAAADAGDDDAEDQEVDARVEQRGQNLPELAELGLGVHGDVARRGELHDEVPPAPELAQVLAEGGPLRARPQTVLGRQGRQRGVARTGHPGLHVRSGRLGRAVEHLAGRAVP